MSVTSWSSIRIGLIMTLALEKSSIIDALSRCLKTFGCQGVQMDRVPKLKLSHLERHLTKLTTFCISRRNYISPWVFPSIGLTPMTNTTKLLQQALHETKFVSVNSLPDYVKGSLHNYLRNS